MRILAGVPASTHPHKMLGFGFPSRAASFGILVLEYIAVWVESSVNGAISRLLKKRIHLQLRLGHFEAEKESFQNLNKRNNLN